MTKILYRCANILSFTLNFSDFQVKGMAHKNITILYCLQDHITRQFLMRHNLYHSILLEDLFQSKDIKIYRIHGLYTGKVSDDFLFSQ